MHNDTIRPEYPVFDAETFWRTTTADPETGGRPPLGGIVNVALGRCLDVVDRWATQHDQTRAAAIREMLLLGALTGERILASVDPLPPSTRDLPPLDELRELIHAPGPKGRATRRSFQLDDSDVFGAWVVPYLDPRDPSGTPRWAVVAEQDDGVWIWDYPTAAGATVRYEHQVRALAEAGCLFDVTDVDGVDTTAPADA